MLNDAVWDVLVIGAGPAGSVAAQQAAASGLRTLLVERHRLPRDKVCGGCLNAQSLHWLERAGLLDTVRALAPPEVRTMLLHSGGATLEVPLPAGLAVSRRTMDAALAEAAAVSGAALQMETSAAVMPISDDGGNAVHARRHAGPATRTVELRDARGRVRSVAARVVVAADGLGHPSLRRLHHVRERIAPRAYIGLGARCEAQCVPSQEATITMALGRQGYAGTVRCEDGRVNVAAACRPKWCAAAGGPAAAVRMMFAEAGLTCGPIDHIAWQGTPALTRQTTPLAEHRLLLIGDAAGYVEPFTGQGMAWAIAAAVQCQPLLMAAQSDWSTGMTRYCQFQRRQIVRRQQSCCRWMARLLRHRRMCSAALQLAAWFPPLMRHVVERVNDVGAGIAIGTRSLKEVPL